MTEKKVDLLTMIKKRYFQLDRDFDRLLELCMNNEQVIELKQSYSQARHNYIRSLNQLLKKNSRIVRDLTEQLINVEQELNKTLLIQENIINLLKALSQSVQIAASILDMAL